MRPKFRQHFGALPSVGQRPKMTVFQHRRGFGPGSDLMQIQTKQKRRPYKHTVHTNGPGIATQELREVSKAISERQRIDHDDWILQL